MLENSLNIEYLNDPYPHCIIDNFFESKTADTLYDDIKSLKLNHANVKFDKKHDKHQYNKFAFNKIEDLPVQLKNAFVYLNSNEFIKQIEKLTGINDIICGSLQLKGAGVHIIKNKGFLAMHTDFNSYDHPIYGKLDRRINLLVYMNKNWSSNYKGDLLMYNSNDVSKVKRVHPIFNRCVIFNTTKQSVHGHPEPLSFPEDADMYRKSIAVYYYTKNNNGNFDFEGDTKHSTLWYKTPNTNNVNKNTKFQK